MTPPTPQERDPAVVVAARQPARGVVNRGEQSEPRQWLFVAVARVLDQPGCQWPTVTLFFRYPLIH